MAGVGTTKIFENDKINVWEFVLEPGETTPVHTHELDYVFYVLDGAPLRVFDGDGRELTTFDASTGSVFVLRMDGPDLVGVHDPSIRIPARHAAQNVGQTRYREILVETK